jgi:hypothetical protein
MDAYIFLKQIQSMFFDHLSGKNRLLSIISNSIKIEILCLVIFYHS